MSRWEGLTLLHQRRKHRTRQQHCRKVNPPYRTDPKECVVRSSDGGAEHWATIALMIETCKINDFSPPDYLTDVITPRNGRPLLRLLKTSKMQHELLSLRRRQDVAHSSRSNLKVPQCTKRTKSKHWFVEIK